MNSVQRTIMISALLSTALASGPAIHGAGYAGEINPGAFGKARNRKKKLSDADVFERAGQTRQKRKLLKNC